MKDASDPGTVRSFGFRTPRFSTNFHFFVEVIATSKRYDAVCSNIGVDGLAADLAENLDPMTEVTLCLLFPGGTVPVRIQACVEYRRENRYGFNFLYSTDEGRAAVEAFISLIQG